MCSQGFLEVKREGVKYKSNLPFEALSRHLPAMEEAGEGPREGRRGEPPPMFLPTAPAASAEVQPIKGSDDFRPPPSSP